ncbi:MAG: DNA-protecting protein DprA, partial [Nitrospirae bacterium]
MMDTEKACLVGLTFIREIGPITQRALIAHFGSARAVFKASTKELLQVEGIGPRRANAIKHFNDWQKVQEILEKEAKGELSIIGYTEKGYPPLLKEIPDPPLVLYVKGQITEEDNFSIGIVGPRAPSEYGIRVTNILARGLSERGLTIVSGLARGIDTEAHKAAILSGGRTIGVLGSGIDVPYPPENKGLMKRIEQSGAVITEFPPGTPPERQNFPIRNRIISGLSLGVIIVEAPESSGALITANYAMEQSREVFAVPGMVTSGKTKGVHKLIKQGATLVEDPQDVLQVLAPQLKGLIKDRKKAQNATLSEEEKLILKNLSAEP